MPSPYGFFDDPRREYVITTPETPLPWINYLGTEEFFGLISNTAGGYCFHRDARLRRLTRYRYNDVPLDANGRYLYVRDADSGDVWNPGWKPVQAPLDRYECRHGLGTTRLTGARGGIEVSTLHFVPRGESCEVWDVTVRNEGPAARRLQLFGFVEWCLWDAQDDATNFQRNYSTGQVEVGPSAIYHVTEYRERRNHYAYFTCSVPTTGFDTARAAFTGVHGGLHAPRAVLAGGCTGSIAHGWQPVGVHQLDLTLAPGASHRFHFLLGYAENPPDRKFTGRLVRPGQYEAVKEPSDRVCARLADATAVDTALAGLRAWWDGVLGRLQVEIDDPVVSRMANIWNPYQCMVTLAFSRSASYFESGIGRGMGYRDSNQDILGVVHLQPERARQRLLDLAATQLADGTCFHQYQPLTKKGNADIGGGFNDDPLWLPLAVHAYVAETGDTSILHEPCPYADQPASPATLLDHLELSLAYTRRERGPHGLPLIGHADWNDCLNLNCHSTTPGESFQLAGDIGGSIAESVMIAGLFCAACARQADLLRLLGDEAGAAAHDAHRAAMAAAVAAHGWDGEWYLRAYDSAGRPVGSRTCAEGRIFIESQGWAVLGGLGLEDGRARRALDAVRAHLATPDGIVLQQPAFATYHAHLGEVSSYPPGYKENAGIFVHNNTWIQAAEAILGDGDAAYAYWRAVCPALREDRADVYRCEPYVYAQMIAGRDAPTPGEARNSWLTGTASWTYVVLTQYLLGLQPTLHGLALDPCLPSSWSGYNVTRVYRGKTYRIAVRRAGPRGKGLASLRVDGHPLSGPVIPPDLGGPEVRVEATVG